LENFVLSRIENEKIEIRKVYIDLSDNSLFGSSFSEFVQKINDFNFEKIYLDISNNNNIDDKDFKKINNLEHLFTKTVDDENIYQYFRKNFLKNTIYSDLKQKIPYYKNVIENAYKGDSYSQCILGNYYMIGENIGIDFKKAYLLYLKSSTNENPYKEAMLSLSLLYNNGYGTFKNIQKSKKWEKYFNEN
jgi:TPR repeat protein